MHSKLSNMSLPEGWETENSFESLDKFEEINFTPTMNKSFLFNKINRKVKIYWQMPIIYRNGTRVRIFEGDENKQDVFRFLINEDMKDLIDKLGKEVKENPKAILRLKEMEKNVITFWSVKTPVYVLLFEEVCEQSIKKHGKSVENEEEKKVYNECVDYIRFVQNTRIKEEIEKLGLTDYLSMIRSLQNEEPVKELDPVIHIGI